MAEKLAAGFTNINFFRAFFGAFSVPVTTRGQCPPEADS
jgi:hypothetical protein